MDISILYNCTQFKMTENGTLITIVDKKVRIQKIIIAEGNYSIRSVFKDYFTLFDESNSEIYIYDITGNQIFHSSDFLLGVYGKLDNDNNYLVSINDGNLRYDAVFNMNNQKIVKKFNDKLGHNGKKIIIDVDSFLVKNRKIITLFSFKNFPIWQHSYIKLIDAEDAFLNSEIILFEDKLFFSVSSHNSENSAMICLDIKMGEIIHVFAGFYYNCFLDNDAIYASKYNNIISKIDPIKCEIEDWDVNQLLADKGFETVNDHRCAASGGRFYFTQTFGDHKAKLGVLNFTSRTVLYKYEFKPENGGIGSLELHGDRIIVHTQDNTLYIFEEKHLPS